jgi:hypothetical protein
LIPPDLVDDAARLIDHYDHWNETYIQKREIEESKEEYIFTHDFPQGADKNFKDCFHKYREELKLYKNF